MTETHNVQEQDLTKLNEDLDSFKTEVRSTLIGSPILVYINENKSPY